MKMPAKALYYAAAAVSCTIAVCLFLLPGHLIFSGLSVLPDDVLATVWQVIEQVGMSGHLEHLAHVLVFATLMLVMLLAWEARTPPAVLAIGVLILGAVIELLQIPVPDHSPEAGDFLANFIGVALGWIVKSGLLKLAGTVSYLYRLCSPKLYARADLHVARRDRLPRKLK